MSDKRNVLVPPGTFLKHKMFLLSDMDDETSLFSPLITTWCAVLLQWLSTLGRGWGRETDCPTIEVESSSNQLHEDEAMSIWI